MRTTVLLFALSAANVAVVLTGPRIWFLDIICLCAAVYGVYVGIAAWRRHHVKKESR